MKPIKFMISGALLILLGPIMTLVEFFFWEFCILCWIVGIPLFFAGLFMPEGGYKARLILQVHDELIIEAPEEEKEAVASMLKDIMEGVMQLNVPLTAEVNTGKSWFDCK